jgi:hypothetical protein
MAVSSMGFRSHTYSQQLVILVSLVFHGKMSASFLFSRTRIHHRAIKDKDGLLRKKESAVPFGDTVYVVKMCETGFNLHT